MQVRFCSDECRLDAWESFHKVHLHPSVLARLHFSLSQIECQHLDLITGANLGKNAMLAFRILTSSGKIYLEYVVNKVKEELEKPETEGGGPEKVKSKSASPLKEPFKFRWASTRKASTMRQTTAQSTPWWATRSRGGLGTSSSVG